MVGWPVPVATDPQITCRIKDGSGNIVWGPTLLQWETGNVGFIDTYSQAFIGPSSLPSGTGGYDALTFTPSTTGDYYMEFDFPGNNQTRTFDYFDITVADAITGVKIPGRVWSKAWQFTTDGDDNTATSILYPYTDDGITTAINLNGISPYRFAVSCNQTGCSNTGNIENDRKSVHGKQTYPQYRIFLNEPDHNISYFPVGELGQLISATVLSTDCNGNVVFEIVVNKSGQVKLNLHFPPPYIDRQIQSNVVGGTAGNQIPWDGKDGVGTPITNGTICDINIEYINGLTNLPLYDAEYMNSGSNPTWAGFIVTLASPVVTSNNVSLFWDDSQIYECKSQCTGPSCGSGGVKSETGGSNYIGCVGTTGCHPWTYCIGDENTINTWWYALSNGTASVTVDIKRYPANLGPITGDNSVCQNSIKTYSVSPDPNSTSYIWTWPAGVIPLSAPPFTNSITLDFSGASPGTSSVTVQGNNLECDGGPISTLMISVLPVPILTSTLTYNACSGNPFSISLVCNPPATNYTWTVEPPDCSSNIVSCPTGTYAGNQINGTLSVSDLNPGTVLYHITPSAGICSGETKTLTVTVAPKPNVTSPSSPAEELCSGGTTNIVLQSGLTGPSLSWLWQVQAGNCNNVQSCPTSGTSSPIVNTLQLTSNSSPGSVIYSITPTYGGCSGDPVQHTVNVLQLPEITFPSFAPVCLNTPAFTLNSATPAGGTYTYNGNPITIFNPATMGIGTHTITYTYTDGNGCTNHAIRSILVQGLITPTLSGGSSACIGVGQDYQTDPGMIPSSYVWTVSPDGIISGTSPDLKSITWNTTGIKSVTVIYTDPNGCQTIPAQNQVTVYPLPVPTIAGNFNACHNQPYTYTTETGMSGYNWAVSPGNALTPNGSSATVTWNDMTNPWIEVNYINTNGCTAVTPFRKVVTVNASPVYSVTGKTDVCSGETGVSYKLQGSETGNWTVLAGGTLVPPVSNVNLVSANWGTTTAPNQSAIIVNYTNALGCTGTTTYTITIHPLPVTTITTGSGPDCELHSKSFQTPVDPGSSFNWSVSPSSRGIVAAGQGTGNVTIDWLTAGAATIAVTGTNNTSGCNSSSSYPLTVNPSPNPSFTACFDVVTTPNARKFVLRGATPWVPGNGVFSGNRVSYNPATGHYEFDPQGAPAGSYPVTYTYTNTYGCDANAPPMTITIQNYSVDCGADLTDPRDGKKYKTALIGGKCWMKENLSYGTILADAQLPQTDNCLVEKYCHPADATCSQYGGLYQWDELMRYSFTSGGQGICPPEWHVPTESEWQQLINAIGTGVTPPADGIAGSFLKDAFLNPGFYALTQGVYYLNNTWGFNTGTLTGTMFWTSTPYGTERTVARGVNSLNPSTSRYNGSRGNAFSVRCVKD